MTLRLAVPGLFAAALFLGACGGGSSETDDDTPTVDSSTPEATATATTAPPTPTPSALSEADLRPLLVTAEDIGEGWYESPPTEEDEGDFCGVAGAEHEALQGYATSVETTFALSESGPWVIHRLLSYGDSDARGAFARYAEVLGSCDDWTETDPDGTVWNWNVREYFEAKFPQESRYLQMDGSMDGEPAVWVDVVFWRRDSVVSMVWYTELLGVDVGDWRWPDNLYDTLEARVRARVE
ncbi:MAG TPA: hypothetical protein VIH05_00305 [Tepidiformaceae bacterium]